MGIYSTHRKFWYEESTEFSLELERWKSFCRQDECVKAKIKSEITLPRELCRCTCPYIFYLVGVLFNIFFEDS